MPLFEKAGKALELFKKTYGKLVYKKKIGRFDEI